MLIEMWYFEYSGTICNLVLYFPKIPVNVLLYFHKLKKNEKKKRENKNSFETWIPRNQVLESLAKIVSV